MMLEKPSRFAPKNLTAGLCLSGLVLCLSLPTLAADGHSPLNSTANPSKLNPTKVNPSKVMQWHKLTLNFTGPELAENDRTRYGKNTSNTLFMDYRLNVEFISPSAKRYLVPGFYAADGNAAETSASSGSQWRVRFSPNETGQWRYKVSFETGSKLAISDKAGKSVGFFDQNQGSFKVTPSDKNPLGKDFRGKGKLAYVGKPFLQFMGDKTFFLKGGANSPEVFLGYKGFDATKTDRDYQTHIQDWKTGDPSWKNGQGKGLIGTVNYLASLDNNVFYFLTMNAHGDGKQVWPWISNDQPLADNLFTYDVSKLAQWNIVFEHMQAQGIMTHFVLTETENESLFEWEESNSYGGFADSRKLYYREMVARFGYLLAVTWNIGEENGWAESGDEKHRKANTTEQRKLFSNHLKKVTYYPEHIVVHNGPDEDYHIFEKENDNILGHKSFTGFSLQGDLLSKRVYGDVLKFTQLSAQSDHSLVITMDEPYMHKIADEKHVDVWRKENVWATLMAGGAGIEYYLGNGTDLTEQNLRPHEAFYKTMATAIKFFHQHVPFWTLTPDENFVDNAWTLKNEGEFYLLYFKNDPQTIDDKKLPRRVLPKLDIAELTLPEGNYLMQWYSPKHDFYNEEKAIQVNANQKVKLTLPTKHTLDDWAVVIKKSD